MTRILCIWLPHWPIQRWRAAQPRGRAQPLLLYTLDRRGLQRVYDCCEAAYRQGVRRRMPLTEAVSLLRVGAASRGEEGAARGYVCRPYDPSQDRRALADLASCCESFCPQIGWTTYSAHFRSLGETVLEDGLYANITGVSKLFGGETSLVRHAVQVLHRQGYRGRLGIADTIGGAWALAHFGNAAEREPVVHSQENSRRANRRPHELARLECARASPGTTWESVRSLPIEALRLTPSIEAALHQLGVLRVEQLAALPRESLAARFGPLPSVRLGQILGMVDEQLVVYREPGALEAEQWLEYPTASRDVVEQWLMRLMSQVADMLRPQQQGALELACFLDSEGRPPLQLRVGLFQPAACPDHWLELVRLQLEQIALPGAIHRIRVTVVRTAPLEQRQKELDFVHRTASYDHRQLARLVDRLSNRLGHSAVVRAYLTRDVQPERACDYRAWTSSAADPASRAAASRRRVANNGLEPAHRPLLVFSPPYPLEVVEAGPDGPPRRCRVNRLQFDVRRWWGPERIETGWWRGAMVRRDYYRVESTAGERFWVFCRMRDGCWFLQGEFA